MSALTIHAMGNNPMDMTKVLADASDQANIVINVQAIVAMKSTTITASQMDTVLTTEEDTVPVDITRLST